MATKLPPRAKLDKMEEHQTKVQQRVKRGKFLDVEPIQVDDISATLELALKVMKKTRGSNAKYPDTPEGIELFQRYSIDYLSYVDEVNRENADGSGKPIMIPNVDEWALALGLTPSTIRAYERRSPEWAETIGVFRTTISACITQLSMKGKIPPVVAMFQQCNNHGYLNTNEFKKAERANVIVTNKVLSLEELNVFDVEGKVVEK